VLLLKDLEIDITSWNHYSGLPRPRGAQPLDGLWRASPEMKKSGREQPRIKAQLFTAVIIPEGLTEVKEKVGCDPFFGYTTLAGEWNLPQNQDASNTQRGLIRTMSVLRGGRFRCCRTRNTLKIMDFNVVTCGQARATLASKLP
jgi:hypothetical protein